MKNISDEELALEMENEYRHEIGMLPLAPSEFRTFDDFDTRVLVARKTRSLLCASCLCRALAAIEAADGKSAAPQPTVPECPVKLGDTVEVRSLMRGFTATTVKFLLFDEGGVAFGTAHFDGLLRIEDEGKSWRRTGGEPIPEEPKPDSGAPDGKARR